MMGMNLAKFLAEKNFRISILESAGEVGGLTGAWNMSGVSWDRFYHVILMSDLHTRKMISDIGLEQDMRWVETRTGFYSEGKLYSMSNIMEFLKFPPLSLIDKFRLGFTIFYASRKTNWQKLEKISVEAWLTRLSGKNVFNKIWLPLLKSKLGEDYRNTSAAFIWATIQRMYAARRTGLKKEMFGYVKGGYARINAALFQYLINKGVEIRTGVPVRSVKRLENGGMEIETHLGKKEVFDAVISTISSKPSVDIAPGLDKDEAEKHRSIRYLGVICPSVLLARQISPYYVTNITDSSPPFTGIIEMTALIDKSETQGKHLVYLPKYLAPESPLFNETDEDLKQHFTEGLKKMYPFLKEEDILFFGISKARIVFALPGIDYSLKLPGVKTSVPGYYIINSAQIVNGTLNVNETIMVAERKLSQILPELYGSIT